MDIRPVVKPLDITVKKEGGKVETSDVVRSLFTREYGESPEKGGPKKFLKNFWDVKNRSASVEIGIFIA